jgi:phosphoserine phosphatase
MMSVAGMSVAYRAKPAVAEKASRQIRFGRLDSVLVGLV